MASDLMPLAWRTIIFGSRDRTGEVAFMLWRVAVAAIFLISALAMTASAEARHRHEINPIPFSHSPCSVLSRHPCTPSFCSVFNHGPCIPEIDYPYGENLQLTVETVPSENDKAKYVRPDHDLD